MSRVTGCGHGVARNRPTDSKKNELTPHLRSSWCIPPTQNAEFVATMEALLDLYCQPYDPGHPLVCMDEQPVQFIRETRRPLPAIPGTATRYDYEYERNGTADIFLFTEPLGQWRKANIRKQRTMLDWAHEVKELLERDDPTTPTVALVCDNLHTHKIASFYEAFPPQEARRLATRVELPYTPKHGSWLNMAECELSILTRQCLDRRIPDMATLKAVVKAWEQRRNGGQKGVEWPFTTEDARIKLKHLYPQIQV